MGAVRCTFCMWRKSVCCEVYILYVEEECVL